MKRQKLIVIVVVLLAMLVTTQVYAAIVGIDNFNLADQDVCVPTTVCASASSATSVTYASAIGGERDMAVTRLGGSQSVTAYTGVDIVSGPDLVGYSQGTGATGTWEIVWDGPDGNPLVLDPIGLRLGGPTGVDLSDGMTNNRLHIVGLTNDQAFTLRVEIYTDAGNWSYVNLAQPALQNDVTVSIPSASFLVGAGAGATFTNVGAIRVSVDGSSIPALDVSFDYISADGAAPTAVTLQDISASGQSAVLPFVLGAFGLIVVSIGLVINRKRKAIQ